MSKVSQSGSAADWIWTRNGVNLMHSYPVLNAFWKRTETAAKQHRQSRYVLRARRNGRVTTKVRNP